MNKDNKISNIYLPINSNNGIYTHRVFYSEKRVPDSLTKVSNQDIKNIITEIIEYNDLKMIDYIDLTPLKSYLDYQKELEEIKSILLLFNIENNPYQVELLKDKEKEWISIAKNIAKKPNKQLDTKLYNYYLNEKRDEFCSQRQIAYNNDKVLKRIKN